MNMTKTFALLTAVSLITACTEGPRTFKDGPNAGAIDRSSDGGFDRKELRELKAGIWVDPDGCDHWIIDDGLEGYLTDRLTPDGRPVCSGAAQPTYATGGFKEGSILADFL